MENRNTEIFILSQEDIDRIASDRKVNAHKYPMNGFAPGFYMDFCRICGKQFLGDKMAIVCRACAILMIMNDKIKSRYSSLIARIVSEE